MGSFSSRQNTNVIPKPLNVLPATESWSTLDAFQATVKNDGHHELIDRSKTQKSLLRSNSFLKNNYKRRTKTSTMIVANLPSSSTKVGKKDAVTRAKTQFITPTDDACEGNDSIHPLPNLENQYSQSKLNARRPTHFYEVRQAMVNRLNFHKLESLISNDHIQSSANVDETATNHEITPAVRPADVSTEKIAENDITCNKEYSTATNQSVVLEERVEDMQEEKSSEPPVIAFRVNPLPHTTFAPELQLSECELDCQSTIAKLSALSSEELDRKEIEKLFELWLDSGHLASIETHALTVSQSQTGTISELADSLTNTNADYIKEIELGNTLHIQIAKAYCIYVWIANNITYDVEHWKQILSESESMPTYNTEAEEVLQTRVTVCTGYANLFKALSSMCGLEVEVIHGHVKLLKSLSKENSAADIPFKPSQQNSHTWNSVSNYLVQTKK